MANEQVHSEPVMEDDGGRSAPQPATVPSEERSQVKVKTVNVVGSASEQPEATAPEQVKVKKRRRKKRVMPEARTRRCGECETCVRPNCGVCTCCRDMKCFGGRNVIRQCCGERLCSVYPNYNHPLSKGTRPAAVIISCSGTDTESDSADPSCYGAYSPTQAFVNPRRAMIDEMPKDELPWGIAVQSALDRAKAAAELAEQQPAQAEADEPAMDEDDCDDERGSERPKALTVGNEHYLVDKASNKHNWTAFVRGGDPYAVDETATDHIEKVNFRLHPDFAPNEILVTSAPFQVMRDGWGTFDVRVSIHFMDGSIAHLDHTLDFETDCGFSSLNADASKIMHGTARLVEPDSEDEDAAEDQSPNRDGHEYVCHRCADRGELVLCDGCPRSWHLSCLTPVVARMEDLPDGNWLCPECEGTAPVPMLMPAGMDAGRAPYLASWLVQKNAIPEWCPEAVQGVPEWLTQLGLEVYAAEFARCKYTRLEQLACTADWPKKLNLKKGHQHLLVFALQCWQQHQDLAAAGSGSETESDNDNFYAK